MEIGAETQQIIAIRGRADLHLIEPRQRAQFVTQRAQVFDARLDFGDRADVVAEAAADRLEVHVVLE